MKRKNMPMIFFFHCIKIISQVFHSKINLIKNKSNQIEIDIFKVPILLIPSNHEFIFFIHFFFLFYSIKKKKKFNLFFSPT